LKSEEDGDFEVVAGSQVEEDHYSEDGFERTSAFAVGEAQDEAERADRHQLPE